MQSAVYSTTPSCRRPWTRISRSRAQSLQQCSPAGCGWSVTERASPPVGPSCTETFSTRARESPPTRRSSHRKTCRSPGPHVGEIVEARPGAPRALPLLLLREVDERNESGFRFPRRRGSYQEAGYSLHQDWKGLPLDLRELAKRLKWLTSTRAETAKESLVVGKGHRLRSDIAAPCAAESSHASTVALTKKRGPQPSFSNLLL